MLLHSESQYALAASFHMIATRWKLTWSLTLPDPISTNPKRRRESPTRPMKQQQQQHTKDEAVIHGSENPSELGLRASAVAAAAAHDVYQSSYYPGLQHDPQLHYAQHAGIEGWPAEPQPEDRSSSTAAGGVLIVVSSSQTVLPKEDYNYSSPAIYTSPTDNVSAFGVLSFR